ncbi:MMPL family transporter [Acidipropionibacterium jensenii]|uniref:MMPL family transporter n=1 Tax=Acidipropionibacterium jensenii TaxID=1749 RepID=UPI00264A2240|nr:MMPL family transporter [Acidipropionibacterium jensenii]MDN6761110.1 MMPL family transporter [Acidipropionibacterium jensenii]MDN6810655.1 MMPL family transporter [Acidipropionibacterium jensenii]
MSSFLHDLSAWCFRRAKTVIAIWLGILALLGGLTAGFGGSFEDTFTIPGAPSQVAMDNLKATFPQAADLTADVVVVVPKGDSVESAAIRPKIEQGVTDLGKLSFVRTATSPWAKYVSGMISDDRTAAVIQVDLGNTTQVSFSDKDKAALQQAGHRIEQALPVGARVTVGGQAFGATFPSIGITEALGVVVALIVLFITLGSIVAAGMPVLTALIGVGISTCITMLLANFTDINSTTPLLAVMLGLAVGIDYALFILSRHRDQLAEGVDPQSSAARAVATSGSAVVFAGTTVIIALVGLAIAGIPFLTVMGVFAAVGVALAVAIALTMLPAFMGLMGQRMAPRRPRRKRSRAAAKVAAADQEAVGDGATGSGRQSGAAPAAEPARATKDPRKGIFGWWVRVVTKVPVVTVLIVVVVLGSLAIPVKDLHLSLPSAAEDALGTPSRQTYDTLTEKFGEGFNGPIIVTADIVNSTDPMGVINGLKKEIADLPGVKQVPVAIPNQNVDTGMIQVIPTTGPSDQATADLVNRLRDQQSRWKSEFGVDTGVTGVTAIQIDVSDQLGRAMLPFALFVVGLCIILLTVVFRSIAVPIKATVGYLLSAGTGLGAAQLVFNRGVGLSIINIDKPVPIISFMPIVVMGILFGLAMDYEVFLVSRMRESYTHGMAAKEAVVDGFVHSGKVVTAAALIMFSVFAFFIPEGMHALREIALALAIGIVVDAFLVRMTFVPAVLTMLGDKAWWLPKWLDERLPVLDIEGEAVTRERNLAQWPTADHTEAVHGEDLAVEGLFSGVRAHVEPGEVQAVVGPPGAVTGLLLALSGRLTLDSGTCRSAGELLPDRAPRVRRLVTFVDAAEPDGLAERLRRGLAPTTRLAIIDHADKVVDPESRAALEHLCTRARTAGRTGVLLGAQRAGRLDWLNPDGVGELAAVDPTPALPEGAN